MNSKISYAVAAILGGSSCAAYATQDEPPKMAATAYEIFEFIA